MEEGAELADAFFIRAAGEAGVEFAADAQDVAAFHGPGEGDVDKFAEGGEGGGERSGFWAAGCCAERQDDGEFVKDEGGILDEHGIWESRFGGEGDYLDSQMLQEFFV